MGGVAKTVGRVASGVFTLGGSEIARNNLGKNSVVSKILQTPGMVLTGGQSGGWTGENAANLGPTAPGGMSPTDLLANTGGAPVLANIAMGVDTKEALAGYFGKSTKDGSWEKFLNGLNEHDLESIYGVQDQLQTIQSNTDLRNQAVSNVVKDFPNIAANAAKARQDAGGEFDEVTKGAMQQALNNTASKYAAGGGLSSGAANEAFAKVGNDNALNKLNYMGGREKFAYDTGANALNARLAEANALRDFQNTMMGGKMQQGFSAQQANLQRQFQGQQQQVDMANQQRMSDQNSSNAMMGALGSVAGTVVGGYFGGPYGAAVGSQFGGQASNLFGSASSPKTNVPKLNYGSDYYGAA